MKSSTKTPEVKMVRIKDLDPYENNARKHTNDQIKALKRSIKRFGFTNPVLISEDSKIIAGHGRVLAAHELGMESVPAITLDGLSRSEVRAYIIADNQIPAMASWDFDVLAAEIDDLNEDGFDLDVLGFSKDEIEDMIGSPEVPDPVDDEEKKKEPKDTCICPKCHHEFVI